MSQQQSLYHIQSNIYNLISMYEEAESDEERAALEEALDISEEELRYKTENYLLFIAERQRYIEGIDKEIKRLQDLKKSRQNICSKLEDRIKNALLANGYKKLDLEKFNISFRKSTRVVIDGEIPEEYERTTTKTDPDKKLIAADLKAGVKIPGAYLETVENMKWS